ncbi:hypothetical protein CHS0354_003627 [Potamilus streckersoni]|uniref:PWWP domain-containing protein n=1 Tax=Potamilus streckersoni TaxID=2493646 RepID=A0AAE0S9V4_9BIVA|nr:hypothetical protein CHS0354_003627 [Potamilus streckersoni]
MADLKRRYGAILKGMKLPVLIEEAIDDVLIVCLEHGSKVYRGALLDAKKRNLPHGVCHQFALQPDKNNDVKGGNNGGNFGFPTAENAVELSASNFRHTYGQNLPHSGPQFQTNAKTPIPRIVGGKTVRNIRLRPRQTLCSKCKASCLDSGSGPVPIQPSSNRTLSTNNVPDVKTEPQRNETKRRRTAAESQTAEHALPKHLRIEKIEKVDRTPISSEPELGAIKPLRIEKIERVDRNSQSNQQETEGIKPGKIDRIEKFERNPIVSLTKTSPFIRISIGEGTVVQIPPRSHEEKEMEDNSSEEKYTTDEDNITIIEAIDDEEQEYKEERSGNGLGENSNSRKHKKSMKKAKEKDKHTVAGDVYEILEESHVPASGHHKKHKRKHKHKHSNALDDNPVRLITDTICENDSEHLDVKNENSEPVQTEVITQRPRLLYTWRQNKGLSPRRESQSNISKSNELQRTIQPLSPKRENQPANMDNKLQFTRLSKHSSVTGKSGMGVQRKEYRLRSREKSFDSDPLENEDISNSNIDQTYSLCDDSKSVSDHSESFVSDDSDSDDSDDYGDGPPGDENLEAFRPLMMKIQTNTVTKCVTEDGRKINVGDIVWGKIQGFPWWPGRVLSITISQRDNGFVLRQVAHVSWFGSSTMSHIQCSDLFPFIEDFKLRYKRKKRGPYKMAIKQATIAAQNSSNTHQIDFSEFDL